MNDFSVIVVHTIHTDLNALVMLVAVCVHSMMFQVNVLKTQVVSVIISKSAALMTIHS